MVCDVKLQWLPLGQDSIFLIVYCSNLYCIEDKIVTPGKDVMCCILNVCNAKKQLFKISEYDQEIQQSQTADKPMAQRGRATQPPRDTKKTN